MILAGDIGGTNSRLGLFDDEDLRVLHEATVPTSPGSTLTEAVRSFLVDAPFPVPRIYRAAFGVAGPVSDGQVKLTNLNWELDERELEASLDVTRVRLINDMVAHAESIDLLKHNQLICLQAGIVDPTGNRAVIAAGTGLGEAGIFFESRLRQHLAFPSEGGHSDFAPRTDREITLWQWLRSKGGPLSYERVVSGPGLRNLYDFAVNCEQRPPLDNPDPSPIDIAKAAMARGNDACVQAMDLFLGFYAQEAANLALKVLATGGVYFLGGIAVSLIQRLQKPQFLQRFNNMGAENIQDLLKRMPVYVVTTDKTGLLGAANFASRV